MRGETLIKNFVLSWLLNVKKLQNQPDQKLIFQMWDKKNLKYIL